MHGYGAPNGSSANNDRRLDTRVFSSFQEKKLSPIFILRYLSSPLSLGAVYIKDNDIWCMHHPKVNFLSKFSNIRTAVRVSAQCVLIGAWVWRFAFLGLAPRMHGRSSRDSGCFLLVCLPGLILFRLALFHVVIFACRILQPRVLAVTEQKYYYYYVLLLRALFIIVQ